MRSYWLALGAAVVMACGDEPDTLEESAQGLWTAEAADGCAEAFIMNEGACEFRYLCGLADGSYGMEVHSGRCFFSGVNLNWTNSESSCAGRITDDRFNVAIENDRLTLTNSSGIAVYERSDGSGATGRISIGCFDGAGTFTANPVRPF